VDGDYHLKSQAGRWVLNIQAWFNDDVTSVCIDAGNPNSDCTGELWPHGQRINLGAYGGTPQASMSLSNAGNIADLDVDGFVHYCDMKLLIEKWLAQGPLHTQDLNRNRIVNFIDLAILIANWDAEPPPGRARNPQPPDGATDVTVFADLSWTAGLRAESHDVYFGITDPPPFVCSQINTTFDPDTMSNLTTYFWRIDEIGQNGTTPGNLWTFTTGYYTGIRCFPAETLIWADGERMRISEITPGQKLGKSPAACNQLTQPQVESIDEHEGIFSECYDVTLDTGNRITVVSSHFFLTASGRWTHVQDLRPARTLQSLTGPVTVKNVIRRQTPSIGRVYNLKIKSSDHYYVGQDALIARDY
jgi:hypothetical protein